MESKRWSQEFREHLEARNFAWRTVEAYSRESRLLLEFLQSKGLESVSGLTRSHLEEYRMELFYAKVRGQNLSAKTQHQRLSAVRHFVRYLVRNDVLLIDVSAGMELPRTPKSLPRQLLSERETVMLLEAPNVEIPMGIRDRAVMEMLYATALRNSELGQLNLEDIDWEHHCVKVVHGKGDKSRVVPMGEEAEIWLTEYLEKVRPMQLRNPNEKAVFLTNRGQAFKRESLTDVVHRWSKTVGLENRVTPHILRHCCATHMLRRGAGLRHLQVMLGHASSDTTDIYTRVEVSDLRRVVMRCHPRERPNS